MESRALPVEAERAVETIKQADIVIGIPSFHYTDFHFLTTGFPGENTLEVGNV